MINVDFGNLFKVELLHKFYTDQLCPDFSVAPSAITQQVINGHKAVAKQYANALYTGIKTGFYTGIQSGGVPPLTPFVAIDTGMQMTFFMKLINPLFANYTNLPLVATSGMIYYFTNRNNNLSNGKSFLTSKILPYSGGSTYKPGDLAVNGAGIVFSAIKSNDPAHLFNTTDAAHWMQVDNNQYLSANDVLQWLPSVSTYNLGGPQLSAAISVLGYDTVATTYTQSVISTTLNFNSPLSSFPLDLSSLDPGKYSLTVNGVQQWIYINDELSGSKVFAVIDIFNDATPPSCQLVTAGQVLTSPTYSIYFLNRATIWKYTLVSTTAGTIQDTLNTYHFNNTANTTVPSTFISQTPIPLSDQALKLTLTLNTNSYSPIACADPQRLTSITQAGDIYSCSEIFLNY
jgi:hypothetical protein